LFTACASLTEVKGLSLMSPFLQIKVSRKAKMALAMKKISKENTNPFFIAGLKEEPVVDGEISVCKALMRQYIPK